MPLQVDETVTILGDSGAPYRVTRRLDHYYCTCPSWKFMRCPIQDRRCKHVQRLTKGSFGARLQLDAKVGCKRKREAQLKVTLAEKWTGSDPTGMFMSEKYDGMRCLWTGSALVSRNNNPVHAPAELIRQLPQHTALDGELFLGRSRFQETMRIVRRTSATAKDWSDIKYMIFDAPNVSGPFSDRIGQPAAGRSSCPLHSGTHDAEDVFVCFVEGQAHGNFKSPSFWSRKCPMDA